MRDPRRCSFAVGIYVHSFPIVVPSEGGRLSVLYLLELEIFRVDVEY